MRSPHLVPLALALAACQPSPEKQSAQGYVLQLEPLLYENGLLAREIQSTAAALHDGLGSDEEAEQVWVETVAPLADHLAQQAALQVSPVEWVQRHEALVAIWTDRADAYRGIADSVRTGDRAEWKTARKKADDAMVQQEAWFQETNAQLAPFGLALDQLP